MKPLNEWIDQIFKRHPPRRCLFRVDAGRQFGLSFGHLFRCLMLADAMQVKYQTQSLFLMRDYEEGFRYAQSKGRDIVVIPQKETADPLKEVAFILEIQNSFQPDWYVCDLPDSEPDFDYFKRLQNQQVRILFLDDFRFANPGADVYLNSNILAPNRTSVNDEEAAAYLLGLDYFIWDAPLKDKQAVNPCHILLTFGGSDPTCLTRKVIRELSRKTWERYSFQVILGPGYPGTAEVAELILHTPNDFSLVSNPKDIFPYYLDCGAAICAGGRTMYELNYLNKKFLPIATTAIEAEAVRAFEEYHLVQKGLPAWDPGAFSDSFEQLISTL